MRRSVLALLMLAVAPAAAQTPLEKCKAITDTAERLKCYDAIQSTPATTPAQPAQTPAASAPQAKSAPASEDPLVTKAKAGVRGQLRNPDSARFHSVRMRTVKGKPAVCGLVNARNAAGVMTPAQPFAFDGEQVYLIIYNPGPANITNQDASTLGSAMGARIRAYNRLCK
jgi:hypothetical protein